MTQKLTFRTPDGLPARSRAVGFLEGETWLNAGAEFDGLAERDQENVRNRIDHWLGGGIFKTYHHGFNAPEHRLCYVFRFQEIRFYGFLCNPKPNSDRGFRLCVLTSCIPKHAWGTEKVVLDRAMRMLADIRSKEAIAIAYPEFLKGDKQSWKN